MYVYMHMYIYIYMAFRRIQTDFWFIKGWDITAYASVSNLQIFFSIELNKSMRPIVQKLKLGKFLTEVEIKPKGGVSGFVVDTIIKILNPLFKWWADDFLEKLLQGSLMRTALQDALDKNVNYQKIRDIIKNG